jgi:pimeloyl-ACP methyl ester carboxylesterase
MRRGFATIPLGQMHFREAGEGTPLILLHPTPYSSRYYLDLAPRLADFRVLVPDLPGCGESCPIAHDASIEGLAGDVAAFMDAMAVPRAHLLGIHGGNKIGAALATFHPERVDRFVFAGMTHSIILDREQRNAEVLAAAARTRAPGSSPTDARAAWDSLFRSIEKVWNRPRPALDRDALRRLADEAIDRIESRDAFDLLYRMNFAFDLEAALRRVTARTLVVELRTSGEDGLEPQAPAITRCMAQARAISLPWTDRELVHDHADRFAEEIRGFLREERP